MPELLRSDDLVLKGIIAGWPGCGKTSLIATANDVPELSPMLIINFEGGLLSVAHRGDVQHERIKNMAQLDEIFWKVANKKPPFDIFKSLGIDSGSELADLCLQEVVGQAFAASQGNDNLAKRDSIDDVQLKDYGKSTRRSTRLFRCFRDLDDISVLMTALPKERYPQPPSGASEQDKRTFAENIKAGLIKPMQILPSFTDKLGTAVLGFLDFCWFLNVAETVEKVDGKPVVKQTRQLLTAPVGPFKFIKTRGPHFASALGNGVEVEIVNGVPTIKGQPAMKFLFDTLRRTEGSKK